MEFPQEQSRKWEGPEAATVSDLEDQEKAFLVTTAGMEIERSDWVLDSGCSHVR